MLSTIFDGVPAPGDPILEDQRVPRGLPAPVVADTPAPDPPPAPALPEVLHLPYETYAEMGAAFPKDMMGNLDWVAAAEQGLIQPRAAADPSVEAPPGIQLDVHLDPGIPNFQVVFPHDVHTYWLRCDSCHPAIFQMRAGADPITMTKIFQGEYCGECHGKVAFPPATGCPRCHTKMAG